jgi:hypothetical protein
MVGIRYLFECHTFRWKYFSILAARAYRCQILVTVHNGDVKVRFCHSLFVTR